MYCDLIIAENRMIISTNHAGINILHSGRSEKRNIVPVIMCSVNCGAANTSTATTRVTCSWSEGESQGFVALVSLHGLVALPLTCSHAPRHLGSPSHGRGLWRAHDESGSADLACLVWSPALRERERERGGGGG